MSFSQGWNLYKTTINKTGTDGNPLTLVVYNLGKTKELKNIPYDKFTEFKGEMLTNLGMKWVNGFAKFEKWTFPPDTDVLKVIINKYYGVGENKEETPTPQPTPKSSKMTVKLLADYLMTHDSTVWDRLKIESGSQLYADDRLQKSYIKIWTDYYESDTAIPTQMKELTMKERNELGDYFEDDNYHSLKNLFMLYGYFGIPNKVNAEDFYEQRGYGLNPKNFKPAEKEEEKLTFKTGDKFTVKTRSEKIFEIGLIAMGQVTIITPDMGEVQYSVTEVKQRFESGAWIKVSDDKLKEGDVYYSKLFEQKLTISKVQDDTIFVDYEDESSERYTPQYCSLMIARGDWIKVVDEEKEGGTEEDIKKAIAALEILAEDGDEDAKKGIEALKILLN